jgi:hypothetical protein
MLTARPRSIVDGERTLVANANAAFRIKDALANTPQVNGSPVRF